MTTAAAVAAGAVGAAVVLSGRARAQTRLERGRWLWAVVAVAVVVWLGRPSWLPVLLLLGVAAAAAWSVIRMSRRRRAAEERSVRVLEACGVLTAELAAGQPPVTALREAAGQWPHLGPAAEAAALGADVPAALRSLSDEPGAGDLALVGAAWQVAHRTGQGLTGALTVVMEDLRSLRETRRVIASELASARATARLVAFLPAPTLAMGGGAGGDPVGFLWHQPLGWACAAAGLGLLVAGLAWIEAIAARVEASG